MIENDSIPVAHMVLLQRENLRIFLGARRLYGVVAETDMNMEFETKECA